MRTGRVYLGDSVYAEPPTEHHGMCKICTNNGGPDKNEIWLEPEVVAALVKFLTQKEADE